MMTKPTTAQRHEIYKKALEFIDCNLGICGALRDAVEYYEDHADINYPDPYYQLNEYIEIIKHEPEINAFYGFWFPLNEQGDAKRIAILKQAIEETLP